MVLKASSGELCAPRKFVLFVTLRSKSVSLCTSLCTKSNRLWKEKCWNKFRYSYIQCFFLWQYNYTWEHHHLFLEWLWVLRILKKFVLDKNQKINVHIMSQILEKTFLTFSFAAVVLSSFDFCSKCITVQSWSRNPRKMELFETIVKN